MRVSVVVLISLMVAGCALARQQQEAQELKARREALNAREDLNARVQAASERCEFAYPDINAKTVVPRATCKAEALAILRPMMPYPDLLDSFNASRMAIAERVQKRQLTVAQADELIVTRRSELAAEEQRRMLANKAAIAQDNLAAASFSAAGPHTCTQTGNTVNCL
jgi:hypothetical protein